MRTSVTALEVRNHAVPNLAQLRDRSSEHRVAEPYGNKARETRARETREDRGSNLGEDAPPRHGARSPNLAPPGPARSRGRRGQSGRGRVGRSDRRTIPTGDEAWSCAEAKKNGSGGSVGGGSRAGGAAAAVQVSRGRGGEEEVKERKRTRGRECADFFSFIFSSNFLFTGGGEALEVRNKKYFS
jgi:hypothetical protein